MSAVLTGRLRNKLTFGDWAVGLIDGPDGAQHRVVGHVVATLDAGVTYDFSGQETQHPKHGARFEVANAAVHVDLSREGIERHLQRQFIGVGPKTAAQIVDWHLENASLDALRETLVRRPWELQCFTTVGTGKPIGFKGQASTAYHYVYSELSVRYSSAQVADATLRRVAKHLVGEAENDPNVTARLLTKFHQDPYAPIANVWGYGFGQADAIAARIGIAHDAPCRVAALLFSELLRASEAEGHTFLPAELLRIRAHKVDPRVPFELGLTYLAQRGYPVTIDQSGRCYPQQLDSVESAAATLLAAMCAPCAALRAHASVDDLRTEVRKAERRLPSQIELDSSQTQALVELLRAPVRLHTLTAGPGCGKTTLMEIFAQMTNTRVDFCAPTGKAAKVLNARVHRFGLRATTIHQLLEPSLEGFQRNEGNPLDAGVVVVDEASMIDLPLFHSLLRALRWDAHLVLVGDRDQLPSVGPGNVLANVLDLRANHEALSVTHRNAGELLRLIQLVRAGGFALPSTPQAQVEMRPFDATNAEHLDAVEHEYLRAVKTHGIANVGLLIPLRRGRRDAPGANVTFFNAKLQSSLNADGQALPGTGLRIGDRVIVRRNLVVPQLDDRGHTESVVNGDTAHLQEAALNDDGSLRAARIKLDDGRSVWIPAENFDHLGLSYAITVHAAQGSEYACVIVVLGHQPSSFLNRPLLYTAVSRARARLVVFGELETVRAIAQRQGAKRFAALASKTNALLNQRI